MTIGEVARRSGVAASALRFYEERELITSERAGSGHRRYPRAVLRRIAFVVFAQRVSQTCRAALAGAINHHVFNTILLRRGTLERCGLPAEIRYRSVYQGTALETGYRVTRGSGVHGFVVSPLGSQLR